METLAFLILIALCGLLFTALNVVHNYLDRRATLEAERLELEREQWEAESAQQEWDGADDALFTLQSERGPWTTEDAARTRDFFRSQTGQRFAEQLRYSEGALLLRAIHAPTEDQATLCGQAAGYRQLLSDIMKLFSPSAESADNSQPGPEQAGEG